MSMSNRLQDLRQKAELSQEDLAERIGVSRQAISKWEGEQTNPDIENIIRLSEVYNTSTDYILKGTQPTVIQASDKSAQIRQRKRQNLHYLIVSIVISFLAIGFVFALSQLLTFPDYISDEYEYVFRPVLGSIFTICGSLIVIAATIILNFRHRMKTSSFKAE